MNKPFNFNNANQLREQIIKSFNNEGVGMPKTLLTTDFVDDDILVKPIDYYYTNAIARSSKIMNECRQISKSYLYTGIEKAS